MNKFRRARFPISNFRPKVKPSITSLLLVSMFIALGFTPQGTARATDIPVITQLLRTNVPSEKVAAAAQSAAITPPSGPAAVSCEASSARLVTSCFVSGDSQATGNNSDSLDAIVSFPYHAVGETAATAEYAAPDTLATVGEVGATWGTAYRRSTDSVFVSAFMRRHVSFGPMGSDGIYRIDIDNSGASPTGNVVNYVDLSSLGIDVGADTRTAWDGGDVGGNADDPNELPPDRTKASWDTAAFDAVGKRSIGDIDLSEDGDTLYGVNLFHNPDPTVFALNISDNAAATLVAEWAVPDPGCVDSSNAGAATPEDRRPWGLKVHLGKVYVGIVCSAETSQDTDDLEAYVYQLDPTSGAWTNAFGPIELGSFTRSPNNVNNAGTEATWRPWADAWPAIPSGLEGQAVWAQPMLTDLEFDMDGSLILGFGDRWGYQTGEDNRSSDASSTQTFATITSGDIMRVCNVAGTYTLENNGTCGGVSTYGQGNGDGVGGGEYYWGDRFDLWAGTDPGNATTHAETAMGGLAFWPGSGEISATAFNPTNSSNSGGVYYLLNNPTGGTDYASAVWNETGQQARYSPNPVSNSGNHEEWGYRLYDSSGGADGYQGKAAGLGDLEFYCEPLLEVGDYVWSDANDNGLQDDGLGAGIPNVEVTLSCDDNDATTTTDSSGRYYFTSDGNASGVLVAGAICSIAIDTDSAANTTALTDYTYTTNPDAGGDTSNNYLTDGNDSDGGAVAGDGTTSVNFTAQASGTNHGFDFGFVESSIPDPVACGVNATDIGGTIFRDYNVNGVQDGGEPGHGTTDMLVTAYDASNTAVATAVVSYDGTYAFPSLADGNPYRIEFSGLPSYLEWGGAIGQNGGTSVQFVDGATCEVDVAVNNSADYCDDNAAIASSCYVFGDNITGTFSLSDTVITIDPTWQRSDTGIAAPDTTSDLSYWQPNMPNHLAFANEVGSVYGVSWSDKTSDLYVSAYQKSHVGYGPGGRGQIYRIPTDPVTGAATGAPVAFVNIETDLGITVCGSHGDDLAGSYDPTIFNEVGRCGLGDLEISDDDSTLFVTDLTNRQVVGIDIATQALLGPWTLPASAAAACRDANDLRPFGLGFKDGLLYVGAVCSGETRGATQNWHKTDLHALVYTLDPATGFSATPVLDYELSNQRLGIWGSQLETWIDDIGDTNRFTIGTGASWVMHRSQMLTDIEFVNNNMILGFRNRLADQWGVNIPYDHDSNGSDDLFTAINEGDVVCTSYDNATGTYIWEGNDHTNNLGTCGTLTGSESGFVNADVDYSGTAPHDNPLMDDGEFYWGDGGAPSLGDARHYEISLGGLAQSGAADLVMSSLTPSNALGVSYDQSGGFVWLNNLTGAPEGAFVAYDRSNPSTFSKAAGLGDVESLCTSAPLEVGNYVWLDIDEDGIQDAGESGIAGVTVTLNCAGSIITTTTSIDNAATVNIDESGQYYFSGNIGGNAAGVLVPGASCTVNIDTTQSTLSAYSLTIENSDGTSANAGDTTNDRFTDVRDSDGVMSGDIAMVSFTAGDAGDINHTFDFGFIPIPTVEIGNRVWTENDGNGIADESGDNTLPVTNTLVTAMASNGQIYTATTDAAGLYTITVPANATYTVTVAAPSGYDPSTIIVSGADNDPSANNNRNHDNSGAVVEVAEENNYTIDFGFTPVPLGSIGDTIWGDDNASGGDQSTMTTDGESGLASVVVELEQSDGTVITTTTSITGFYIFPDLPFGMYTVTVDTSTLPSGYSSTPTYDADGGTDSTSVTTIDAATPDDMAQDFSYPPQELGSIGDTVWLDLDGDGVIDSTESGIGGVVIELELPDGTIITTTTSPTGTYLFSDLPAGSYTITVDVTTVPLGLTQTYDFDGIGTANTSTTTIGTGEDDLDQDFGYQPPLGSIGDTIWGDDNSSGGDQSTMATDGESGLAGVVVELEQSDGTVITTTTSITGFYIFPDLPYGIYTVTVDTSTLPSGYSSTPTYDADGGTDSMSVTTIDAATPDDMAQDFSYPLITVPPVPVGSIGDTIWGDDNSSSGNQSTMVTDGESGLAGVVVELGQPDGTIITTSTSITGFYIFPDLPYGMYTVTVDTSTLPSGYSSTPTYDADGGADSMSVTTIGAATPDDMAQDFSYPPITVPPVPVGSIGDTIWGDDNSSSGNQSTMVTDGEGGLAGVVVELEQPDGTIITTTTSITGFYLFPDLPYGTYTVTVDTSMLPSGYVPTPTYDADGGADSTSVTTIGAATPDDMAQDFSYPPQALGSIGDTVWLDLDGDGVIDSTESGIGGVVIELEMPDGTIITTTTSPTGIYSFPNLSAGIYTVTVDVSTLPAPYIQSYDADGLASANQSVYDLAMGEDNVAQDFGYSPETTAVSLSGSGTQSAAPTILIVLLVAAALAGLWFVVLKRQTQDDSLVQDSAE